MVVCNHSTKIVEIFIVKFPIFIFELLVIFAVNVYNV